MATAILDYLVDYQDVRKADDELRKLQKTTKNVVKDNKKLEKSYEENVKDLKKMREEMRKVAKASKEISSISVSLSGGVGGGGGGDGSKTINNITNATNDMTASFDKLAKTIGGMNGGMLDLASSMLLLRNNSTEMLQANRILEVQHNSLERKYRSGKLSLEEYNKAVKNLNGHYDNAVKKIKPVNSLLVSKKFALVAVAAAAVSAGTAVSSLILENTRLAASVDMSYESLQRWQNTALRVGVTNEQFADQVRDWNLKVAEAATGGGELVSIFEEYEKELKNVNQEQLYGVEGMESITKALLDNGVSAEQTRSVLDRMASDLDKMLPILDGTTKGVNDFNYALTEVDQANIAKMASSFDYMKDNVVDVAGSVVADFAPAIWQVFDAFSSVVHTIGQVNDEYAITARLGGVVGITFGTALDVVSGLAKGIEYALLAAQRMFYGIGIAALDLMDIEFISDMLGVTAVGDAKSGLQVKLEGVVTQMKEVEKQGDILAKRIVTNFSGNLDQILSGETRDSSDFNIERPEASKSKVKTKDKVDPNDSKSYLAALSLEIEKTDALAAARQRLEWISGGVAVAQDALATSYSEGAAGELEQVNEALAVFENKHKMMIEFNEEYQDLVLAQGELEKKVADEVAEHKYNTMIGNLAMLSSVLDQDSNAYKAIATTQAIADTFAGANSALNPAKGSPDAMLSSTQRMINAGVIVTTGIANVSNIMAAKDGASMVGVPHYNSGTSFVDGSGTSKSDDVPAMLSRGESVLTASASQALGRGNIDAMNAGHGMSMGGGSQQINAGITINGNVDQNTLNELNSMQEKQVKMIARTMADKAIKQQKKPGGLLR